jgi:hypothetical protein
VSSIREFISAVTFIGVIFHEFGHKLFCNLTGVNVVKVCYFRFGNPSGYVIHERPNYFTQSFFVAVGPLLSGFFFTLLFYFISRSYSWQEWPKYLFIWLGASVAVNSFPSNQDAKSLWKDTNRHITRNLLAIVGYPFAIIIWIANNLSIIFFDLIYAGFLYYLVDKIIK